jgi:hypothetical protein
MNVDENGLGNILGDFFTNGSGHTGSSKGIETKMYLLSGSPWDWQSVNAKYPTQTGYDDQKQVRPQTYTFS